MTTIVSTKFVPTGLAAAAIGLSVMMTVGVPSAHASEKYDTAETVEPDPPMQRIPVHVSTAEAQILEFDNV